MTRVRRLLAVFTFVGVAVVVSSSLQGQTGKTTGGTTPKLTPQLTPAKSNPHAEAAIADSRFTQAGAHTYQPVKGDIYFALGIKPTLEAAPNRPRDILIVMSTAGTQAGTSWIAGHQIAEGIIETAKEFDRVSLWTANEPKFTTNLTKGFQTPKDFADGKRLKDALAKYRSKEFPAGATDLKNALSKAIESFEDNKDRQRILLFLGDGLSTHTQLSDDDRAALANDMVRRQIAFFPVPLGQQLDPNMLHGLANATGGIVLRTTVEAEKLVDALKRYDEAFAAPILYNARVELPGMTDVCPAKLPPLRGDQPTLVVGRMKVLPKEIAYTIRGTIEGKVGNVTVQTTEPVHEPNLENYFLVSMIDQWAKAKNRPAILRADRALALAYEQTRLQHLECLEEASLALEENKLVDAARLFRQARTLAPHDNEADAGIKIVDRLKDGSLDKNKIRQQLRERRGKADKLETVDGKQRWVKVDLAALNQEEQPKVGPKQPADQKQPAIAPEDLLKEHRERQAVEEQKVKQAVDEAIRQARVNVRTAPDDTLEMLRNLFNRVKDHPDLGGLTRDAETARLQAALRTSAAEVQLIKLKKQDIIQAAAVAQQHLIREQERKSFEDRVEAQFRLYKNLMTVARFEERTKQNIMQAMVAMQEEARAKGYPVPIASKAMYDIALAALPLQTHNTLIRQREAGWLTILMGVEKSHVPYADEPFIHFPPLATWKALIKNRKDKYEVTSFPDDEAGRKSANEIKRQLDKVIPTKALHEKVKLRTALEYFSDSVGGLPILIDSEAFKLKLGADSPDPYEEEVQLPPVPARMQLNLALRLILSQVGKGEATYLIRREYVEITTEERYIDDKVIRVYPVGDLVMPLGMAGGMAGAGVAGGFGGGLMLGGMGGMGGMMMGGMMGMPMGGMAGMMGMPMGGMAGMGGMMGMPMGGMAGMGAMMGMPMGGMAGMGMPMGGMAGMGAMMGMPMGGMAGMGMPMGGMAGMGGMMGMPMGGMMPMMGGMMPMMGGMMPMMGGGMMMGMGAFSGGFNGNPGAIGAAQQANSLKALIMTIVAPGNWYSYGPVNPFPAMGGFGMAGFPGMGGAFGAMAGIGGMGMIGGGAPPDPNANVDPQKANTIDFFQPALALIVRAPSRVHTSITGGIVGGKKARLDPAAMIDIQKDGLAKFQENNPKIKVAPEALKIRQAEMAKKREALDPAKVWNEALAKEGVDPGMVVATADFLFEAGEFEHAAEFLKAVLRKGLVVRPWVFEALAVALEASRGDPEEIQRVRLSGIALDPNDAQGFMSAARAMADRGHYARALSFCKQAAQLEPNDYHPYEVALAYAESAKDTQALEWAFGKLVAQDWPVDNLFIQKTARQRVDALTGTLKAEKRFTEAKTLQDALTRLVQRDLRVNLVWDNSSGPCELEMKIKEPTGSVCSLDQKQTPGGGVMNGYDLMSKDKGTTEYVAAQAFSGEYEVTITRVYGQPLNGRARLEILMNAGTPKQTRRLEIVTLDQKNATTFKINLKDGRRTELALVSVAAHQPHKRVSADGKEVNSFNLLRQIANPSFYGANVTATGGAGTTGQMPTVASLAAKDSKAKETPVTVLQNAMNSSNGVGMMTQVQMNPNSRNYDLVMRPFFASVNAAQNSRPAVNLSMIPGGN
jgi:tetratricopeptide (TPR) repeat protein